MMKLRIANCRLKNENVVMTIRNPQSPIRNFRGDIGITQISVLRCADALVEDIYSCAFGRAA